MKRNRRGPHIPTTDVDALPFGVDLFPKVRTLADIGLDAAHAWAHASCSHDLDPGVYGRSVLGERGRMLHEEFGFAVLLVTERSDENEEHGSVIAYVHEYESPGVTREVVRSIGLIDLQTGEFIDGIELAARDYLETRQKGAA